MKGKNDPEFVSKQVQELKEENTRSEEHIKQRLAELGYDTELVNEALNKQNNKER